MKIIISNQSGIPIYEQIKNQIKEMILSGILANGEMLPSIRSLAKDLRVSVITTNRAYNELENEGFITAMQGKGFFVAAQDPDFIRENFLLKIEEHFRDVKDLANIGGISTIEIKTLLDLILKEDKPHD